MSVSFGSKIPNHTPHSRMPHRQASHRTNALKSNEGSILGKPLVKYGLLAAVPIIITSWLAHVGSHAFLSNDIKSKNAAVSVFEGKSTKLEKLKEVLNKGFEPDSGQKPLHTDTVFIPDNVTHKEQGSFLKNIKSVFLTQPLEPKEVKKKLIDMEYNRRYENFEIEAPPLFDVIVGDGVFFDENGGKYVPIEYYAKDK